MSSQHTSTYISLRASYNKQITVLVTHSWPCTVLMQMLFYILKQNKMARPNDINIYIIRFTFDRGEPFVPVSLCRFILIHIRSFEQRVVSPASNCLQFWKCNIYIEKVIYIEKYFLEKRSWHAIMRWWHKMFVLWFYRIWTRLWDSILDEKSEVRLVAGGVAWLPKEG